MFLKTYFLISSLLLVSCYSSSQSSDFGESVPVAQLESFLAGKKHITIIDVRTPQETTSGTLDNARVINVQDPAFEAEINKLDKTQEYLLYCAKGIRSARALEIMKAKGFSRIHHLEGGYEAWLVYKKS